ncbi:MAG: PilZ domain-containing protein [Acidobacteriia bacterium]|nr:PilZ domain-containing protein [Terriglobia bacterium]
MGSIEQRRHPRLAANLVIRVSAIRAERADHESGRMLDVSEGGLCFVGARYLPPGTSVKIEFADCSLVGEVRHCRMRDYSSRVEFVTGVQVHEIEAGQESWRDLTQAAS